MDTIPDEHNDITQPSPDQSTTRPDTSAAPSNTTTAAPSPIASPGVSSGTGPGPSSSNPPPPAVADDPTLQTRVFHYRSSCLNILAQYQTHHLIPHSGKVVIFDSQLVVKHAFDGMVHHDLTCLAAGTLVDTDDEVAQPIEEFRHDDRTHVMSVHSGGLSARAITHAWSRGQLQTGACSELFYDRALLTVPRLPLSPQVSSLASS